MPLEQWSDDITLVHLADEPAFTEDMDALIDTIDKAGDCVLDFSNVKFINSSNLGSLLSLRKAAAKAHKKVVFCGVQSSVWGAMLVTSIDKLFTVVDNVPLALASLQLDAK